MYGGHPSLCTTFEIIEFIRVLLISGWERIHNYVMGYAYSGERRQLDCRLPWTHTLPRLGAHRRSSPFQQGTHTGESRPRQGRWSFRILRSDPRHHPIHGRQGIFWSREENSHRRQVNEPACTMMVRIRELFNCSGRLQRNIRIHGGRDIKFYENFGMYLSIMTPGNQIHLRQEL